MWRKWRWPGVMHGTAHGTPGAAGAAAQTAAPPRGVGARHRILPCRARCGGRAGPAGELLKVIDHELYM